MTACTVEMSVWCTVMCGRSPTAWHISYPIIYNSFPSLPVSCPTQCSAKGPAIYFTVRNCQLFNWRRCKDRAKKGFKCLQLTFRNPCLRQYLVFYCVICGPQDNEKVKSLNCFFPIFCKRITVEFLFKGQVNMKSNGLLPCLSLRLLNIITCLITVNNS